MVNTGPSGPASAGVANISTTSDALHDCQIALPTLRARDCVFTQTQFLLFSIEGQTP
jgi:hypothetical protein